MRAVGWGGGLPQDNASCRAACRFLAIVIPAGSTTDPSVMSDVALAAMKRLELRCAAQVVLVAVWEPLGWRHGLPCRVPCMGRSHVDAVFARRGASLVAAVLRGMTETAQPDSLDSLAEVLLVLLKSYPSVTLPACAAVLQDAAFVGNKSGTLPVAVRDGGVLTLFHGIATGATVVELNPFRDLMIVFVRVVQGHAATDTLAAALPK